MGITSEITKLIRNESVTADEVRTIVEEELNSRGQNPTDAEVRAIAEDVLSEVQTGDGGLTESEVESIVTSHIDAMPDRMVTVGENGDFNSVQKAHDSMGDWDERGLVFMLPDYRYSTEKEGGPIQWTSRRTLMGSNNELRSDDPTTPVIEVNVDAPINRPPGPRLYNFQTVGGKHGILKLGGRYTKFGDITVKQSAGNGIHIRDRGKYVNEGESLEDANGYAPNTHRFENVVSENAGELGWYIGEGIHGVTLTNCNSYFAGDDGIYWGANTGGKIVGGSFEQADGNGLSIVGARNLTISGAYIEANAQGVAEEEMGLEMYIGGDTSGLTIENTYFNGFNWTDWSIYNSGRRTQIKSCYSVKHTRGFIYNNQSAQDTDWYRSSHETPTDDFGGGDGFRTRSFGTIIPQDLTDVPGEHDGDEGKHVTADGAVKQVTWIDGQWQDAMGQPIQ